MRKLFILSLFFTLTISTSTQAQIEYIFAAKEDASTYVEHYMNPAINGLLFDLSNGWYSRSKTHKKFGMDLSFSASIAMIPADEQYFQFNPDDYNNLAIRNGDPQLPTIAGGETTTVLETNVSGISLPINAIDGHGNKWMKEFFIPIAIPMPMVQVGFGLPFKTDLKLRFFPKIEREGIAFNLFGLGVKHNLSQYFMEEENIFTLSGLAAFTNANVSYIPNTGSITGEDQQISMGFSAFTAQIIAGINVKIVNFYAGLGYVGGNSDFNVKGTYEFDLDNSGSIDVTVDDPINLNFAMSGFKTTLGTRFNLGPVKVFGDYTIQKYPSITAGIAVSIN